jgi:hypothetical protein
MADTFRPTLRRGLMLHLGVLILNISLVTWLVIMSLSQTVSGFFILLIIAAVAAFLPIPVFLYRLLSLLRGKYIIDRDGLHIEWGLRTEDIPMYEIEWVRSIKDVAFEIALPPMSVPGGVLGNRTHRDLGEIEFIASDPDNLLLVATTRKVIAISPQNNADFLTALRRNAEMGTISPIEGRSSKADFLIGSIIADRAARTLILIGAVLSAGLLVLSVFIIPTRKTIPLGFNPINQSPEAAPAERLLLLPILSLLTFTMDLGMGAYLFRKKGYRIASYFVFGASFIPPLSFIGLIIFFILL